MSVRPISFNFFMAALLAELVLSKHTSEGSVLFEKLTAEDWKYCIVGAGPGGLQLGQFMHKEGWNYVILERNAIPGSFFSSFPIHRQLISLNKVHTGRSDVEFNLRHDWNSLLGTEVAPVTNRSKQRFPHADVLVDYFSDFAKGQEESGRIFYGVHVQKVGRDGEGFKLRVAMQGLHGAVRCASVIVATGVGIPNMPEILLANGWNNATRYVDMPRSSATTNYAEYEQYAGKRVLVVGLGNAALETADALAPHVAYVHLIPGRAGKIRTPLFAHETRYVGDVRMMRASIFDSYLLKSLDGGMNGKGLAAESHVLAKCGKQWCMLPLDPSRKFVCFFFHSKNSRANLLTEKLSSAGYVLGSMGQMPSTSATVFVSLPNQDEEQLVQQTGKREGRSDHERGKIGRRPISDFTGVYLNRSFLVDEDLVLAVSREFGNTESPYPLIYDKVVRCTGWKHDVSIYEPETMPTIQPSGKFAALTDEYEAVGVKNMYFVGAAGHGKDHRKAAGGFIHGFRYMARALLRMLKVKQGKEWPHTKFKLGSEVNVDELVATLLHRIDVASGPYQMVHVLGDAIVVSCKRDKIEATYFEEMPLEYFNRKFKGRSRFFMNFGYGLQRQPYPDSVNGGTWFQAMLWYYPGTCGSSVDAHEQKDADGFPLVQHKELLALKETLHTEWNKPHIHEQVADFMQVRIQGARADTQIPIMQHGDDVHLRKPLVSYLAPRWGHGAVDLLVKNVGKLSVSLHRIRVGSSAKVDTKMTSQTVDDLDEVSVAELDSLVLKPGEGKRLFTEEKERWEVRRKSKTISRMTVDCAYGIVQDWLVGHGKERTSQQRGKTSRPACAAQGCGSDHGSSKTSSRSEL